MMADEPSIEELCKPLSAKVQPRTAYSISGNVMEGNIKRSAENRSLKARLKHRMKDLKRETKP